MPSTPDWTTYAILSDDVYNRGAGNQSIKLPAGVTSLDRTAKRDGAFFGQIYQIGNVFVVAIRGTDHPDDFETNVPYGAGWQLVTSQLADTLDLVDQAEALAAQAGGSVSLTGHSLGGGLAALAAAYTQNPAYVFDPAPFNKPDRTVESIQETQTRNHQLSYN